MELIRRQERQIIGYETEEEYHEHVQEMRAEGWGVVFEESTPRYPVLVTYFINLNK